ncbi:MAG: shikimate dehydrogenase [Bacteroidia bacterium]|nr:shikimate dehydrogenase [Bacteroidia bacterium]
MKQFGLIGYPLSHSFSKKYFTEKFEQLKLEDHAYDLFPIDQIDLFPSLIKTYPNLVGLNVTIPYKSKVMEFLDEIDESAIEIGAVNTIKILDGRLIGYNTDVHGFHQSLLPLIEEDEHFHALILGNGGAAKAVIWVLEHLQIEYNIVSRKDNIQTIKYSDLDNLMIENHKLIINTTPLGMAPNEDSFPPIPYDALGQEHILYDMVYNPVETRFMKFGSKRGAIVKNGLEMLHLQADRSWEIWNE